MTENQVKFTWEEESHRAFESLKQALTFSPVLSFPKSDGEFILDTDASNIEIGTVLLQRQEGEEKVIAYFSRVLNKTEKIYCVTRHELLAIVEFLKSFYYFLYGRKILVRADYASLR